MFVQCLSRQVSHDPDMKIQLPKGTKFRDVLIKSCLHKTYPQSGPYQGGIVFNRYYGMGEGIGFTKEECESMWGSISLDAHYMDVKKGGEGTATPTPTATPTATPTVTPTPTATPTATTTVNHPTRQIGDCLEVWWEHHAEWFPCVIREQAEDRDGSLASCCHYDDGIKQWHNLDNEVYRVIEPTAQRISKLTISNLRVRLSSAGVRALTTMGKDQLVKELLVLVSAVAPSDTESNAAVDVTAPAKVHTLWLNQARFDQIQSEQKKLMGGSWKGNGYTHKSVIWSIVEDRTASCYVVGE